MYIPYNIVLKEEIYAQLVFMLLMEVFVTFYYQT